LVAGHVVTDSGQRSHESVSATTFGARRGPLLIAALTLLVLLVACSQEDAELLTGPSAEACNTFEEPNVVRSEPFEDVAIQGGGARTRLPPLSFVAMTLRLG
jgi:hypothetical protein